ncbi:MAG: hypothetical protein ACOX2G_08215 [Bacillota bacterium]|jgi:uncharacterized membrane protein required for colicin V production
MFPWLDLLLAGILLWTAVAGYVAGTKKAGTRMGMAAAALVLPLPFAGNCAANLRPLVEPVLRAAMGDTVVTASTGAWELFGPWQVVLDLPVTGAGNPEQGMRLVLNLLGLLFLVAVLALAFVLVARLNPSENRSIMGAVLGFGQGLVIISAIIFFSPIGILAEKGPLLSSALTESVIVKLLMPLLKRLARVIAPFVL